MEILIFVLILLVLIIIVIIGYLVSIYNSLVFLKNDIARAWSNIDVY